MTKKEGLTVKRPTAIQMLGALQSVRERLDDATKQVKTAETPDLANVMEVAKPLMVAFGEFTNTVRVELIDRAVAGDNCFVRQGKQYYTNTTGGGVIVQERESLKELPTAQAWLYKHKRDVYLSSTGEQVQIADEHRFLEALAELETVAGAPVVDVKTARAALRVVAKAVLDLNKAVRRQRQLNQKAVERAIADGQLKAKDLERLYEIRTIHAVLVKSGTDEQSPHERIAG